MGRSQESAVDVARNRTDFGSLCTFTVKLSTVAVFLPSGCARGPYGTNLRTTPSRSRDLLKRSACKGPVKGSRTSGTALQEEISISKNPKTHLRSESRYHTNHSPTPIQHQRHSQDSTSFDQRYMRAPALANTHYQRARESAHLQHNSHSKRVAPGAAPTSSPRWQQEEAGSGQQAARLCPCARAGGVLEAICVQWTEN